MRRVVLALRTARGRALGLVAVLVLTTLAAATGSRAVVDDPPGGPGVVGLQLAGTAAAARWQVERYGADAIRQAVLWDLAFIVCWSPLLALVVLWAGQNYRTVSTRRAAVPMALSALGAGVLDAIENLMLWLAVDREVGDAWALAAVAAWGKWLIVGATLGYAIGGLLSLMLRSDVRAVLRSADESPGVHASRTITESRFGLAFSGGGVRAASITLGALQALEEEGTMGWGNADHVASVSGGSYMAGAWSLARSMPGPAAPGVPEPWAAGGVQPGPEERHLRANLGYLLSNSPRGSGQDTLAQMSEPGSDRPGDRRPAVVATVLTGMLVNALVFLGMLWVLSQLVGWFYRWYFALGCPDWREDRALEYSGDHGCLTAPDRVGLPVLVWLGLGLVAVLLWVVAAKASEVVGRADVPAWLLIPKYLGYGGLGIAAALALTLGLLPVLLDLLWQPVAANDLLTNLLAVAGALGSGAAVFRLLRKPLAKVAPVLGGLLFLLVLLFLLCRWAIAAMSTAPDDRDLAPLVLVAVALLVVHLAGAAEAWSLAAFYRGKLRSAFATYRVAGVGGVRARAYSNNEVAPPGERCEPLLSELPRRTPGTGTGTPLTICASATVSGRQVRTHYGIPALSVTFTPDAVTMFAPLEEDGLWQAYECPTSAMDALRARLRPRLTTMMAVGLSGAAVSPAMGRFRVGPVSMLLAFFNVRLGAWIPNPRYAAALAAQDKPLPGPGLGYLLKEFLGFHDPSDLYLYVTDGGHWENTALVELLRTCYHREIVCVDADAGPGNLAKSISQAVDLAQLECAASVALNLDVLRAEPDPSPGRDYSPRSVNLGLVRRTDGNSERISVLWYCKPALTQDMPPQLLAYREVDPTFPRVSTINQFFHVAQFSAYRDLGRYNARKILSARCTLERALEENGSFADFRTSVAATPPELPEGWVFAELVQLVERLAADHGPAEQVAYQEALYTTVRGTITGS